ncbi:hypothetical protein [Chamaesiphon minutus]|uniref:PEP-CTERM exosortase interaction domain-containing protein n=1 Tax=Chamaesiphon minutus (strain ATCC 27169 / PCC 6605) TaxID=1173020 RepID=K9UKQ2_CHAP6|nr:hypothetical protein [Chamaesiphon minutus]AFY94759.1 hypothetical protein Cha6605_3788 [Chamaesiphon minutus PCC 6605]
MKSLKSLCHNAGLTLVGALTLAAASAVSHSEKAAAIDLKFDTPVGTANIPDILGRGPGFSSNEIRYTNVAPGVDAKITATVTGTNYSFLGHYPNYSANTAEPNDDEAFRYQIATNQTGQGQMTYKIDLFNSGGTFTTAFLAPELNFLIYDVDGEAIQNEAVRIAKGTGLVSYQVGSSTAALIPTEDATSYLFSGRGADQAENNTSGAAIFRFQNVNSVTFQFEANTTIPFATAPNVVFSALDGDLSYIPSFTGTFNAAVDTSATAIPEPFTIIGTLIGGTAAFRMRKNLKIGNKA